VLAPVTGRVTTIGTLRNHLMTDLANITYYSSTLFGGQMTPIIL
jgi:hypothetical protein